MRRLFIDLEICNKCPECVVTCNYFYHPQNNGITNLREYATFALYCRQCEESPCVKACYHNALEKQADGVLRRYSMRCTSCKSCSIACPFGTVYTDLAGFVDSVCDLCKGRLNGDEKPLCVLTCSKGALEYGEVDVNGDENLTEVFEDVVVRVESGERWQPFLRDNK